MSYSSIPWLSLTAILTALGLVLSYGILRRNGVRPALRVAAVSLVPIAAYLTGATEMLWKIGVAIGQFGTGFAFSTTKWVGIGVDRARGRAVPGGRRPRGPQGGQGEAQGRQGQAGGRRGRAAGGWRPP